MHYQTYSFHPSLRANRLPCERSRQGFALVIALSLMAFVLLLLLSMTALTRVESSVADQSMRQTTARQNALLGLQLAVGQLQQQMGPDQRVSYTAGILDSDPYDPDTLLDVPDERAHWTGVRAVSPDAEGEPVQTFEQWLVSGYTLLDQADVSSAVVDDATIDLTGGSSPVKAGKVSIASAGDSSGSYAYWIGDEGVKAKANIESTVGADTLRSAERFGIQVVDGLDWFVDHEADAARAFSWPALEIAANGDADSSLLQERFHDLTFYSHGLLTDTVEGGFKKDLTSELFGATPSLTGPIFEPLSGTATVADPGGPLWEQARSWLAITADGSGNYPVQASSDTQAGLHPVLAGFQLYWVPTYTPSSSGGNPRARMNLMPAVVLWNPYNVPLEDQSYTVTYGKTYMDNGNFAYFNVVLDNWELEDVSTGTTASIQKSQLILTLNSGRLEPGQAIVFSPPGASALSTSGNTLTRGYRPSACYYFYTSLTLAAPYEYRYDKGQINRVHGLLLERGTGNGAEPLQAVYYMADGDSNLSTANSMTMQQTPSGAPINTVDAFGYKFLQTTTDNVSFWGAGASLLPGMRSWLAHLNPRARIKGPIPTVYEDGGYNRSVSNNPSFASARQESDVNMDLGFVSFGDQVSVGHSENSMVDTAAFFEAPPSRADLHSIGQMMHFPLYNDGSSGADEEARMESSIRNARFGNLIPAYAVGSSEADPNIELDATERTWGGSPSEARYFSFQGVHHDYSYKLNRALWDRYFFSTVPAGGGLPENPRLVSIAEDGSLPRDDVDTAAEDLMVNGAFNVNSVSVEAWKALLASFYGLPVGGESDSDSHSPILRVRDPLEGPVDNSSTDVTDDFESYAGYRRLSDAQIEELAERIVEEVKLRGPFGSMAEFINRMPERDGRYSEDSDAFRLRGTLAAAIAKTAINAGLRRPSVEVIASGSSGIEAAAEAGWRSEGLPGWLTQADLLQRLGPVLTVRSDTFRIRAYGESINSVTGDAVKARCEAIVQRMPEFVYQGQVGETAAEIETKQTEQGRRFAIVDFRWLSEDEI
ncbi:hypothetical protein SH580_05235 [Coraliomargarita algicola]|uniref:Tfp pilus assembly protein PilX n=1 Tax=Coraliomargarita algicola TaxID=3092156 RepID=A0ABZ0RLL6_9BACT|nr:hypothetical protein [Coraliomargarita sp. J2-16]WPJ97109.1 hypothetical protein SH580_05235 [Coraliomargarita sp. J2-16]